MRGTNHVHSHFAGATNSGKRYRGTSGAVEVVGKDVAVVGNARGDKKKGPTPALQVSANPVLSGPVPALLRDIVGDWVAVDPLE